MLVSLKEILSDAYKNRYAVGAFNCISVENVIGAIEAAEEMNSPIILQLAEIQFPYSPMEYMAPVMLEAAKNAKIPVTVHLDHGQSFDTCIKAMKLGFNSVMFDGAVLPFEENVYITKKVVDVARIWGVDVEAELGKVGNTDEGGDGVGDSSTADHFTDVEESALFIEKTGVDALAIAIGNLHGKYIAAPTLNITRLKEISEKNKLPLVLHGGTGTSVADFKACAHNGIAKVNVATAIQIAVTDKIKEYLATVPNPGYIDMKWKMIEASKEIVAYHIDLFESNNRY